MALQLKFDISSIKNQVGQSIEITREIELPSYNSIEFGDPWKIKVLINHTYNEYIISGQAKGSFIATCDRCLEPFSDHLEIEFNEVFIPKKETLRAKDPSSTEEEQENIHYFTGDEIDLTAAIMDSISLSLPMKQLCSKLCKGLCTKCGTNLNINKCTCKNNNFDIRLAKLADLLTPTSNEDKGGGSDGQPKK